MGRERQIQKNEETRKAIIDAAVSIGLEEGFEELSIRKITDRLGYSAGIVYHYFKDKQEILDTIHNTTSMEMMDVVDACVREDRSFAENTKVVFKMLSEISIYEPEMFKLILLNRYSPNNESIQTWLKMIRHCVEIGINSGELRNVDSEIVSYIMLNSFLVVQMIIAEKDDIDEKMIEHVFDTELDIILNGLLNKEE
ncbi:MAG: TetR/AcrR family transcriptional regulator [Ruminococcus sp.]